MRYGLIRVDDGDALNHKLIPLSKSYSRGYGNSPDKPCYETAIKDSTEKMEILSRSYETLLVAHYN